MGYVLCSLDWKKFSKFITKPTKKQLLDLSECASQLLDEYDSRLDEEDPVAQWPSDPEELGVILNERLAIPDWYKDLSDTAKELWERAMQGYCYSAKHLGFDQDSDGIGWDVIEIARKHHRMSPDVIGKSTLSQFSQRPFRHCKIHRRGRHVSSWFPSHSMHSPDEVPQLLEHLTAIRPIIAKTNDEYLIEDYEDLLMPLLESVIASEQMLFVYADT